MWSFRPSRINGDAPSRCPRRPSAARFLIKSAGPPEEPIGRDSFRNSESSGGQRTLALAARQGKPALRVLRDPPVLTSRICCSSPAGGLEGPFHETCPPLASQASLSSIERIVTGNVDSDQPLDSRIGIGDGTIRPAIRVTSAGMSEGLILANVPDHTARATAGQVATAQDFVSQPDLVDFGVQLQSEMDKLFTKTDRHFDKVMKSLLVLKIGVFSLGSVILALLIKLVFFP